MQNQPIFKKPAMPMMTTTKMAPASGNAINSATNTLFRDVNQPIFNNNPATPQRQQHVFSNMAAMAMQSQPMFSNNPATPQHNLPATHQQRQQVFSNNLPATPQRQPMFKKPATPRPQNQPNNNMNMAAMQRQHVFDNNMAAMQNQQMFSNNPATPQRQHVFNNPANNNMAAMQNQPNNNMNMATMQRQPVVFKRPAMPMPPQTKAKSSRSVLNHAAITLLKSAHVMDAIQSRNPQHYEQATKFVNESADLSLDLKLLSRNFHSQCLERYILENNMPVHQKLIDKGMEAAEALAEKRAKYEALMAGCSSSSSAYGNEKDKSEEEEGEKEKELIEQEEEEEGEQFMEQEESVVEVDANADGE